VVNGEVVDNTKILFVVADPRQVWLTLNVRQEDARYLHVGLPVRFRAEGNAAEVAGQVSWVSTEVDEKTRTVKVRATLPNADGRLRANTFGPGRMILREEKNAVVVPKGAVHWDGSCFIVFVRDKNYLDESAPKVFHVRKVRPGAKDDIYTELLAGVLPGEVVASTGSGILLAELLKGKLGDG
jgi:cobalt-zinc-cadmium efflux system membrane fusion protein